MSYSKTRIPGLLAPSLTPGSVVFHGVTPGLRNIALIGEPVENINSYYHSIMCLKVILDKTGHRASAGLFESLKMSEKSSVL